MDKIFGPASKDFVTGDKVEDENDFNAFADSTAQRAALEQASPSKMILHIGKDDWAFPIPIQKTNSGDKWYFELPDAGLNHGGPFEMADGSPKIQEPRRTYPGLPEARANLADQQ